MADIDVNQADPAAQQAAYVRENMIASGIIEAPKEVAAGVPGAQQAAAGSDGGAAAAATTQTAPFSFESFKEFGFQKPEDIVEEIKTLRAFKEKPPVAEHKFENDEARKLYDAFTKGKNKDVYEFLNRQQQIDRLIGITEPDENNAAEIVKYGMKEKYPTLNDAQIEYKFKKDFSLPAKPAKGGDEEEADYKVRVDAWQEVVSDKKMELLIAAKMLQPDIAKAKQNLVLPTIEQAADQKYLDYQKAVETSRKQFEDAQVAYKAFTPATAEMKLNFVDKDNKVELPFQYVPDAASFAQAQELATDDAKFNAFFTKADGSPDREKFMKVLYAGLNAEKMVSQAMTETVSATLKSMLPDNQQANGLVRQLNGAGPVVQSEMDKDMERAGIKRSVN